MSIRLFLCGDLMTGRGIDQILPHPGDPALGEELVHDAREYVALAEAASGPIARPVDEGYPWGEALEVLERAAPAARVANLETAVTTSDARYPKEVCYRMHPANVGCLTAARLDVVSLANNHVLDYGEAGLRETIDTLAASGVRVAGAGRDLQEARRSARVPLGDGRDLVVLGLGSETSGVPREWAAGAERPGVAFVDRLSDEAADAVLTRVRAARRAGDLVVVSIHWGSNWGWRVPHDQARFAHRLIDGGVDLVHGHSSHHPRPIEVYRGRLVLHGCGDLVNDYEGIAGYEEYRGDLAILYLADLAPDGALERLHMVPLRRRRLRLERVALADAAFLARTLDRESSPFGARVLRAPEEDTLQVVP